MPIKQKITPNLWFDHDAEAAVAFYLGIFDDAQIVDELRSTEGGPAPAGSILAIGFQLEGQDFVAINGGPHFEFTGAISLFVDCADQDEIDKLWSKLGDGGRELDCGWLQDRFGVTWQINTSRLPAMLRDPDRARAARVMQAMLKMRKIDIQKLQDAYDGR